MSPFFLVYTGFCYSFVNMTRNKLRDFFTKYPAINKTAIAKEAGITPVMLHYILSGERNLTENMANKIKPVIDKYEGCNP